MYKIFIDCGFHHGEGLMHFAKELHIDDSWIVYAFEPNKQCDALLRLTSFDWPFSRPICFISDRACYTHFGQARFMAFERNIESESSYINIGNRLNNRCNCKVDCMDFSFWISQIPEKFEIYCKMDIEGAEFAVLREMIKHKSICQIKKLWVEFHHQFFRDENSTTKDELISEIRKYTTIEEWH